MADPVPLRMNDASALKLLREIVADSARIIFTNHARQRMRQRHVTPTQIISCLLRGIVSEPVSLDLHGNWKLTVTHRTAGKDLNVAVAGNCHHGVLGGELVSLSRERPSQCLAGKRL